jgi:hypothetical protein
VRCAPTFGQDFLAYVGARRPSCEHDPQQEGILRKWLQGLIHRGVGQEDGFSPRPISPTLPFAHHHGIDGVGLEVPAAVAPVVGRPILVIGGQAGDAAEFRLQPFGRGGLAPTNPSLPAPGGSERSHRTRLPSSRL